MSLAFPQRVAVAGATGLVGQALVDQLLGHPAAPEVVALVRDPLRISQRHHRLRVRVVDYGALAVTDADKPLDALLCALGTTIAKAGSQAAMRAVDHDAVLAAGRWALACGATTLGLVSSINADPAARLFYPRMKGEAERDWVALGAARTLVARPSLLRGDRPEIRPVEAFFLRLAPVLDPMMVGRLRRYRSIAATDVAAALIAALSHSAPGVHRFESDQLETLARCDG
jgi:uncharacterized protein YbjT (DUF2867 family)